MTNSMDSYLSLGGNELVNASRLAAYVANGVFPSGFEFFCRGCDGLDAILPCVNSDPPIGGYAVPELDPAPWYDAAAPESKNFAGLLVTSVTMSAPYSRTVTQNIRQGQTLGKLKLQGRTIVVHGWLVGKTCCGTQYGLRWLTTALGDQPCTGGDCGGVELDFLDCCPSVGSGEDDCLTTGTGVYVRPDADSEYERAEDFFRRLNGVGVIDGPNVLSCKGSSCGCGCSALTEVEFTLSSSSPYLNSFGTPVLVDEPAPVPCVEDPDCEITWVVCEPGTSGNDIDCPAPVDCLEDPNCPLPPLPPTPSIPINDCGCNPFQSSRLCAVIPSVKEWGSSTLNIDVYSGSSELRNLIIRVWQNPLALDCSDSVFSDCSACSTLLISYIPPGSHLILSGETRSVTIECGGRSRNASQNVTNVDGQPFDWPDLTCSSACACIDFDCLNTSSDATVSITRIDREL